MLIKRIALSAITLVAMQAFGQTPVYSQPAPVYAAPQPTVVYPAPVYVQQAPVVVAPPAAVVVPPGVVYLAPTYPAPAVGFVWEYHPRYGWGWHHPRYGWHRGWR